MATQLTNAEARKIATDLHWLMLRRGVYHSEKAILERNHNGEGWVCSIWEPDYAAMWLVFLRDSGSVVRATRSVR